MMLLLDVGNTSVKWGVSTARNIEASGCFVHRGNKVHELADQSWAELPTPAGVCVANVAGAQLQQQLSDWIGARWDIVPEFMATTAQACGVSNAYAVPEDLGVDRWAALVGAYHHVNGNTSAGGDGQASGWHDPPRHRDAATDAVEKHRNEK